jgi:D-alanyl-D-alanine carboxypeptidase
VPPSRPARHHRRAVLVSVFVAVGAQAFAGPGPAGAAQPAAERAVERGLERLVATEGGPVGAIATLHRGGRTTVLRAGRADVDRPRAPRRRDHMRIASVAKMFSGAVALRLAQDGVLSLDDTIGELLPSMPTAWSAVTVRQLLNHTSGVPDYTESASFFEHARQNPRGYVSPPTLIDWVRSDGLVFAPGSRYEYSNTDNIVVGLIAEQLTGRSYRSLLGDFVFSPAKLRRTSFPGTRISLPSPFIHGYLTEPGEPPEDVTTALSPSGAWASGAIVSTPADMGSFVRADLAGEFFGREQQREQLRFVPGSSSPPGPGTNAAGLAVFRYKTRCGTVYGHTGDFPGYVQWIAATKNGRRSATTTLNIPAPTGELLAKLRAVQTKAVCALLGRRAAK